jgi:SAM-dependent methyltransferase
MTIGRRFTESPFFFKKMTQRYDKYNKKRPIHWDWYYNEIGHYKKIVESAIVPFKGLSGTVLDIGSGDGMADFLLTGMGLKLWGIEPEEDGNDIVRKNLREMVIFQMTVEEYERRRKISSLIDDLKKYDFIFSLNTIEHVTDAKSFVRLMDNVTQFAVIVTDENNGRPINTTREKFHIKEFSYKELEDLFIGFKTEPVKINCRGYIGIKVYAKNT